ncbi:iron-containing alcohol dehydrogenase [Aquirhabdus parva]|uniref:Iron-containing alcohol dehydrogenase n=1 Tax=Aquirhabdus parva TaxID=2283318 RepID=A0A345P6G3_9GAMM|nr:iron-containing alcohol dehydrogenase [Aquirhabdus parva]AXI02872.1 iron-containing alcohol dehydrogenase [Aquirhabdus parva]
MQGFSFDTVRKIVCAAASRHTLGSICLELGIKHVLFVTDPGIIKFNLHLDALKSLEQAGLQVTICADVQADPPEHIVVHATESAKVQGIDGVIGYGGGSSMDVAKLIALLANPAQSQNISEIYGVNNIIGKRLPLIQIPTTAGTGSEVTAVAIVTTGETTKMGVVSPTLFADVAILDAELTLDLPAAVTAATGIDAMVHAIEAFTSQHKKNPYSDMLAREALKLLDQHLQTAVHHGHDINAREKMLLGAMMAGQAFANSPVAAVHALAYPLGGHYHIPHGLSNALVLIPVLRFNLLHATDLYAELYRTLEPAVTGNSDELAEKLIQRLEQHIKHSGLPKNLSEMRIKDAHGDIHAIPPEHLPILAADAMKQTRLLINNPRPLVEADALAIYQAAYS